MTLFTPKVILATALITLSLTTIDSRAQYKPKNWGKVTPEELTMKSYTADTSAVAIILVDDAKIEFIVDRYLHCDYTFYKRVKILKPEGFDYANVETRNVKAYGSNPVSNFRAQTINTDENGNPVITKLESNGEFIVDKGNHTSSFRFTMPAVKVGSIIEYCYTLNLIYNFSFGNWTFQDKVPVLHSNFTAIVPRGTVVNVLQQGDRLKKKYGEEPTREWSLDSLPALKDEPFSPNAYDYIDRVRLQVDKVRTFGEDSDEDGYYRLYDAWPKLIGELYKDDYSTFLCDTFMARKEIEPLRLKDSSDLAKVKSIQKYVANTYKYDDTYGYLLDMGLHEFIEKKKGSNVEINVFLTSLLRQAGIKAYPLLVSKKAHGRVSKLYPFVNAFDYLIVVAYVNGEKLFLDATDPDLPFFLPNKEILNTNGLEVKVDGEQWDEIPLLGKSKKEIQKVIDYSNPTKASQSLNIVLSQYGANAARQKLKDTTDRNEYLRNSVWSQDEQWTLDSTSIKNIDNCELPLIINGTFSQQGSSMDAATIYINPFEEAIEKTNPFPSPNRMLPVDLKTPMESSYVTTIKLPLNYAVSEMPEPITYLLPNKKGALIINYFDNGNEVTAQRTVIINNPQFKVAEYQSLKNLFDALEASSKSIIVVTKK